MSRELAALERRVDELSGQVASMPIRWRQGGGGGAPIGIGLCLITSIDESENPDAFSMQGRLVRIENIDTGEYESLEDVITLRPMPGMTAQQYLPFITPPTVTFYFVVGGHKFVPAILPIAPLWPEPTNTESSEC